MNGQISLKIVEETSIVVNWTTASIINKLEYSIDGGKTWTQQSVVAGTEGICRISGLTPNTEYKIVLRFTYTGGSLTSSSTSNTLTVSTYDYPHIIDVAEHNLIIGTMQRIYIYNPRKLTVNVSMLVGYDRSVIWETTTSSNGLAINLPSNLLYQTIPNDTGNVCFYRLTYGDIVDTYPSPNEEACFYEVNPLLVAPTFTNFTYKDTNTTVSNVLGTNQEFVAGLSKLQININSSDKMIANCYSTPNYYDISCNVCNFNQHVNYSTNNISVNVNEAISYSSDASITIGAVDSRLIESSITNPIIVHNYNKPTVQGRGIRLNNFENETTIKINGTYTPIYRNSSNKNNVTLKYRYREVGGSWNNWTNVTPIKNNNDVTCNDIILSLDNTKSFNVEVQITDSFGQTAVDTLTIDVGESIFFISSNKEACYINGQKIIMYNNISGNTLSLQDNKYWDGCSVLVNNQTLNNLKILRDNNKNLFRITYNTGYTAPHYYLLAKLPAKGGTNNGVLRIHGYLGHQLYKATIDCTIFARSDLYVNGNWYGNSSAFTYFHELEIYQQTNGELWVYLKVKSTLNTGVLLNVEGTNLIGNVCNENTVYNSPSGTLIYTINDTTLDNPVLELSEVDNKIYYKSGDTFSIESWCSLAGFITGATKSVFFTITTPKSLKNITNITINNITVLMRTGSGYINNSPTDITKSTSGYTFSILKSSENSVSIGVNKSNAYTNVSNNTPVAVHLKALELTFS